jgi:hypothetical protein
LASFTAAAARSTFAEALSVFARAAPTALTCEAIVLRWSVICPSSVLSFYPDIYFHRNQSLASQVVESNEAKLSL